MTETAMGPNAATTQVYRVYIKATPRAVWDAITTPEWTRKFGYGGDSVYELRPGGAYRGYASPEMRAHGAPEIAVDGEVIEVDPPRRLVQTFRMCMDPTLIAEGFTRLTYELEETRGDVTRLTVIHELANAPVLATLMSGGMEDTGAGGGWAWVLSTLKTVLETGEAITH